MKKFLICFFTFIVIILTNTTVLASEKRDYSLITNDKTIEEMLGGFTDDEIKYLNGDNPYNTPISIEFKDMNELGAQYRNNIVIPWINNYEGLFGPTTKVTIYINKQYKKVPSLVLYPFLRARLYQNDLYDSVNEELYIASCEAATWMAVVDIVPSLEKLDNPLVKHLNNIKDMYVKGNYTSKYLKNYVLKNYPNLDITSPGFEEEELYQLSDEDKQKCLSNSTTNFDVSDDKTILAAIEEIKNAPNGKELYEKIYGKNSTGLPIKIEYANLGEIDKSFKSAYSAWHYDNSRLNIYIDSKYANLPKEAMATLIIGRLSADDAQDSINEEIYSWTLEAAAWTYFTKNNPNLKKIDSEPIKKRLNVISKYYEQGNYTDEYIKLLVKNCNLYKSLPETSPGYEQPKTVDNSMFHVITSTEVEAIIKKQVTKEQSIPKEQERIALKGVFYDKEIPVNTQKYNEKIKNDNTFYLQNKKALTPEQYHLYRIMEKIIRANNIDFIPWRVVIEDDYDINAASTDVNLVIINRGLYNAFKHNDDALAFVLSHELSHLLLNHLKITEEHNRQINAVAIRSANRQSNMYAGLDAAYNIAGDNTASIIAAIGFGTYALINGIQANTDQLLIDKIYAAERSLEYEADNEGFNLMYRAGYDIGKASETFVVLNKLPNVYTRRSTHPPVRDRYLNLIEVGSAMNISLRNEGKNNIINSNVLSANSDKSSTFFYIDKCKNYNRSYKSETDIQRMQRIADFKYRNNQLPEAINYLKNLSKLQPSIFIHPLRISYINEYLYKTQKEAKYLRQAKSWVKKASKIAPTNEYVKEQLKSVNNLK